MRFFKKIKTPWHENAKGIFIFIFSKSSTFGGRALLNLSENGQRPSDNFISYEVAERT